MKKELTPKKRFEKRLKEYLKGLDNEKDMFLIILTFFEEALQEEDKEIIKEGKQMVINKESFEGFLNWIKQRNEVRRWQY